MRERITLIVLLMGVCQFVTGQGGCQPSDLDGDGWTTDDGDCDDNDPDVHPGAPEICDGIDNDCDDLVDDDDPGAQTLNYFIDADGDLFGSPEDIVAACEAPEGYVDNPDDCDDNDASINPDAEEVCDEVDNDCDGSVDEEVLETFYGDADGDGYGDFDVKTYACTAPEGYADNGDDCDDGDAAVNPGADEYCDAIDNDCDGMTDEDDAVDAATWYFDGDLDGYGSDTDTQTACEQPLGFLATDGDCNDNNAAINPDAEEVCLDGDDNDCDGTANGCPFEGGFSLSSADVRVYGSRLADTVGSSVASPGDVNGDGIDDVFIGAPGVDGRFVEGTGARYGAAYLVYGDVVGTGTLANADAVFYGEASDLRGGVSVAGVGDITGDGVPDLLIGAPGDDTNAEDAGAVFFFSGTLTGEVALSDAQALILGLNEDDAFGTRVAGVGDLNGDGVNDIAVGAPGYDAASVDTGAVFVFYGPLAGSLDLSDADVTITGVAEGESLGFALDGGGDVNGDGSPDLVVGAPALYDSSGGPGHAYVFFGPLASGTVEDADAVMTGEATFDEAGWSVAIDGDFNDDGIDDLLVGAPILSTAYLIFGPVEGDRPLAQADVRFEGANNSAGWVISPAGDINQDGIADVMLGAPVLDTEAEEAGGVYIVPGPFEGTIVLSETAMKLTGELGAGSGYSLAPAGDVNDDGVPDLLVGSPFNDAGGDSAGAVFVVYGPVSESRILTESSTRLVGEGGGSYELGTTVAWAGDVQGNGSSTFLVGAPYDDAAGTRAGAVYLFRTPVSEEYTYTDADATLIAEGPGHNAGRSVAYVGDVNGDGYDDVFLGAPLYSGAESFVTGAAYLVYGPVNGPSSLALADARFTGEDDGDQAGLVVSSAGDFNCDGTPDLMIGAPYRDEGASNAGAVYIVYGPPSGSLSLADADVRIIGGVEGDLLGQALASAGDLDGDGCDDILIGATGGADEEGTVYVVLAPQSGTLSIDDAWSAKLVGESSGDLAGRSVAGGGDVNGDGIPDILVGAAADGDNGDGAGSAYVVFGPPSGILSLADADAKITGEGIDDLAGRSVAFVGDVDGDSRDDIVIGSPGEDSAGDDAGAAFLILSPVSGTMNVADAQVKVSGEAESDLAGWSVSSAGDLDGDGLPDFLVGAKGSDYGGSDAGAVYAVFTNAM